MTWPPDLPLNLNALEWVAIVEALRITGGNRTRAAALLGVSVRKVRIRIAQMREATGGRLVIDEPADADRRSP